MENSRYDRNGEKLTLRSHLMINTRKQLERGLVPVLVSSNVCMLMSRDSTCNKVCIRTQDIKHELTSITEI